MEKFKIYGYTNLIGGRANEREITITNSDSFSEASTYNESFSIGKHDSIEFNFDITETLSDGTLNPYLDLLMPESVIGLHLLDRESFTEAETDKKGSYYRLKVVSRTPNFFPEGLTYSIKCQDYANRVYSQQGNGLSMEETGTLRELSEGILGQTRKNNLYKDLNKDIFRLSYHNTPEQEKKGFTYDLPYINYLNDTMQNFKSSTPSPYLSIMVTNDFVHDETYDLHFDLIGMNATINGRIKPFNSIFQVVGTGVNGQTFVSDPVRISNNGKAMPVSIPFTFVSGTAIIDLKLIETESGWEEASKYSISVSNLKITRNKTRVNTRGEDDTALFLNHLENFKEQFVSSDGLYYSETKMTFSIENSNLYNALVSLAELFDAQVKFDYLDNAFFFVKNQSEDYKGYRLHPEVNLSSISRPETSGDFATVLHLEGGSDIDGVVPSLPREWRMYLSECVSNNFIGEWFNKYNIETNYTQLVPVVNRYINEKDSKEEREAEIEKFAAHMDKIPTFESTIYDFSYFNKVGMLDDDSFIFLNDLLRNDIRKMNIALNINSYNYYTLYSEFVTQLQALAFYVSSINVERTFQYSAAGMLEGERSPEPYTSSWVSYMNNLDNSLAVEANLYKQAYELLGLFGPNEQSLKLSIEPGTFVYNALKLFGYKDKMNNGIRKLVEENLEKINKKREEKVNLLKEKEKIEEQLNDPTVTDFIKQSLSVELSGVEQGLKSVLRFLGMDEDDAINNYYHPGIYNLESQLYLKVSNLLPNKEELPNELKAGYSLHELLFDRESEFNLVNKKEKTLELLLDRYEPFNLEARYENSDEPTAYSLLEQGLNSFTKINRPQIEYNISTINIGAIDGYEYYTHPEVGDKILLDDSLYMTYDEEETNYLIITGYTEKLREYESLSLKVEKDDESEILIKRMLEQTNFISMKEGKRKSNVELPVPQELKKELPSVINSIEELHKSELSISNIFDVLIKK